MFYLQDTASERIDYRPLTAEHIPLWIEFLSDKESTKFFPELDVAPLERSEMWINSQLERYENGLHGMTAMHLRETGEFIGQVGLLTQEVDGKTEIEIGYHLLPNHRGKGYATEGAKHMKKVAKNNQLCESIISIIHEQNYPSQAVAQRNGMKEDFRTVWKDLPVVIYRVEL